MTADHEQSGSVGDQNLGFLIDERTTSSGVTVLMMRASTVRWEESAGAATVIVDEAGCLAAEATRSSNVAGLILPPGTTIEEVEGDVTVTLDTGQTLMVGDDVVITTSFGAEKIRPLLDSSSPCAHHVGYASFSADQQRGGMPEG